MKETTAEDHGLMIFETPPRSGPDPASLLDFDELNHFDRDEFPAGALEHTASTLILYLEDYRSKLGYPVIPSPVPDGWFRKDGSSASRHYAVNRLSDAGDVFPQCDIRHAWMVAMNCKYWGGIGVYLDTTGPSGQPESMLHLDCRGQRTIWMRHNGHYIYPMRSADERRQFWKLMGELPWVG